jgi:transposase
VVRDNSIMIISSPFVIILSTAEHQELTVRAHAARTAHRDVIRARIVLAAADGGSNAQIAAELGCHLDTVRKWRRRFWVDRLAGLADRPRSGRPRQFSPVQVAEVKALACELPTASNTPLAKWSCPDLAVEATRRWRAHWQQPTSTPRRSGLRQRTDGHRLVTEGSISERLGWESGSCWRPVFRHKRPRSAGFDLRLSCRPPSSNLSVVGTRLTRHGRNYNGRSAD